jgi:hypothetical protein
MKQRTSKFEVRFWTWLVRIVATAFFGIFFAVGCITLHDGLTEPLDLEGSSGLNIFEIAPFGLIFMMVGLTGICYVLRPIYFWEDYLEPAG